MFPLMNSTKNAIDIIDVVTLHLTDLNSLQLPSTLLRQARLDRLRLLARRIETAFPEHSGHGERTANYALLIANAAGLAEEQVIDLQYAALLHDIGLLSIPGHLIDKALPLTLEEYVIVQSHPRAGAAILSQYPFLLEPARLIAHHHERWDGAGYPYGLRGTYIPKSSRILAIADAFDAIASRTTTFDIALRSLRASSGSQFDPALLATFCILLENDVNLRSTPQQFFETDRRCTSENTDRSLADASTGKHL